MIGDFNPLGGWWKMSAYSRKIHYFWLMPILAVAWVLLWINEKLIFPLIMKFNKKK